jgi:hypothetical protein
MAESFVRQNGNMKGLGATHGTAFIPPSQLKANQDALKGETARVTGGFLLI